MLNQSNPCTRCGKQRVISNIHKERVGGSLVTVSSTICPDPECQAIVEKQLEKERVQRAQIISDKQSAALRREKEKDSDF